MNHFRMMNLVAMLAIVIVPASGQHIDGYNYAESNVKSYVLLDPLTMADGTPVRTSKDWWQKRRPQILELFRENVFGRVPANAHIPLRYHVVEKAHPALGGKATRTQVTIYLTPQRGAGVKMHLLVYLPAHPQHHVSVILGLNFGGNQTVAADPGILLSPVWTKAKSASLPEQTVPEESTRGTQANEWQVDAILARGYGLATAYYGDIEPDFKDSMRFGIRQTFLHDGQTAPAPDEWGALAAWAWGLSRAVDYLQSDKRIDDHRIVVTGHSRLGKAADWAAAEDQRFAAVLSTESGKGGQSLYRRNLGETIAHLEHSFPYWFCGNYKQWVDRDDQIPVDGNLLLALIAPRPLYVASAVEDEWSDPRGEFQSAVSASRVYALLGKRGLPAMEMPQVGQSVQYDVGYHVRSGKHDVTAYDWAQYLDFLDMHFGRQSGK
jgi:hypothetical protein